MIPIGREKKNDIPRARKNAHQAKDDQVSMRFRKSNGIVDVIQLDCESGQTWSIKKVLYDCVQQQRSWGRQGDT